MDEAGFEPASTGLEPIMISLVTLSIHQDKKKVLEKLLVEGIAPSTLVGYIKKISYYQHPLLL